MLPIWVQSIIGWLTLIVLVYAAVSAWRGPRRTDPPRREDVPSMPDHPPSPAPADDSAWRARHAAQRRAIEADAARVIEWYRATLDRLPQAGQIEPVDAVLTPEARRLAGLRMHVGIHPFHTEGGEWVCTLEFKIAAAVGGSSIAQGQGLGTPGELRAHLDSGLPSQWIVKLLERGGEEIWRGGDQSLDERIEAVRAGTHAAQPQGRDCYRLDPQLPRRFDGEVERLFDTDYLAISLHQCSDCGQRFLHQFISVWGDRWGFWVRVSDEEAELIRQDFGWAPAILLARRRLTDPPGGREDYWDDSPEMVLRMGPRS